MKPPTTKENEAAGRHDAYENLLRRCRELEPVGARVPIILTSRADSVRVRMASCAVAVLVAHARRSGDVEALT
jgi:hypothetical protein